MAWYDMPLWPHVWAIPVVLLFGVYIGWLLRGLAEKDDSESGAKDPDEDL